MIIDVNIQMPFHPIELDDLWWYKICEREDTVNACDSVFGCIFLWASEYYTEVAKIANCAVVRYFFRGQKFYSYPLGGTDEDKKVAVETLLKLAHSNDEKLNLTILSESHKAHLDQYFHGIFEVDGERNRYDYVYGTEKLASLKGKKLSSKRNHINRFIENNDWSYEKITYANKELCLQMEEEWYTIRAQEDDVDVRELDAEKKALHKAIDHYEELDFTGGILKVNGKTVAFTIGEKINSDMMVVHFEKANPEIQGAFQMINQQFVINNCADCNYINREEDTGDLGLRKAKKSYCPDMMVKKYYAIESDIVHPTERDFPQIINIWNTCFSDEASYIQFYLDNRYTEENMLCIMEDDKIVSMASFLPAMIKGDLEDEILYVYAVATLPEYRRRGYAAKILEHARKKWKKALVLQHAAESLENYYSKHGFEKRFKRYLYDFAANTLAVGMDTSIDGTYEIVREFTDEVIADYAKERENFFADRLHVWWDNEAIRYALMENALCGGFLVKSEKGYLLCRIENEAVRIVESLIHFAELESEYWQKVLQKLCEDNQCTILWIHNRGGMILPTKEMKKQLETECEKGYLGLTLD